MQQIADMEIKHLKLLQSKELELTHKQAATELKKKVLGSAEASKIIKNFVEGLAYQKEGSELVERCACEQ